jgi:hypothetical protein
MPAKMPSVPNSLPPSHATGTLTTIVRATEMATAAIGRLRPLNAALEMAIMPAAP